jgi:hypothetical protein
MARVEQRQWNWLQPAYWEWSCGEFVAFRVACSEMCAGDMSVQSVANDLLFACLPSCLVPPHSLQSVWFQETASPFTSTQKTRGLPGSSPKISCRSSDVRCVICSSCNQQSWGCVQISAAENIWTLCLFSATGWNLIFCRMQFTVWQKLKRTSLHQSPRTVTFVDGNFANYSTQTAETVRLHKTDAYCCQRCPIS